MTVPIVMPKLGFVAEDATLSKWLRHPGDGVTKGETVAIIETDKVTYEIEAPMDGIMTSVLVEEGQRVPFGTTLTHVVKLGESGPSEVPFVPAQPANELSRVDIGAPPERAAPSSNARIGEFKVSPRARQVAESHGIDLRQIQGSGPNGRILESDVLAAVRASKSVTEEIPLSRVQRIAGRRMAESFATIPHFYLQVEADATELARALQRYAVRMESSHVKPTVTDLLVYSVARALREHPIINASFHDGKVLANLRSNVGIAIDTPEGLIVAVIPDADSIELPELCKVRTELTDRARKGGLRLEEIQGGTFTISNLGMFGVDVFHPIINPPQAAILAVGRLSERCVWQDNGAVGRPTISLVLACDHRVLDGATGARFLMDVLRYLPAD